MKTNFQDDKELIKHLQKGDERAYQYLVDMHYRRLCVFANSLVHDVFLAEDIVQNVLLKVWKKRNRLKDDFNIKGYLSRSVYNEFIDQQRKQSALPLELKYIDALTEIVEDNNTERLSKLVAIVKKEIQNLPPKCREVFMLSKQEGLTNIEISGYLNISVKTVENQITKAFRTLRKKLDGKMGTILFLLFDVEVLETDKTNIS
ncbi:RNA polymerase sigma factor [Maribacter sp. 2307ULW6-5]|uniref:RNA polymerase sigma factor n=1 Tax=Maribacter sp. 2307ULW6-5 TaxID=3386275 RepID=UPI0039BCF0B6